MKRKKISPWTAHLQNQEARSDKKNVSFYSFLWHVLRQVLFQNLIFCFYPVILNLFQNLIFFILSFCSFPWCFVPSATQCLRQSLFCLFFVIPGLVRNLILVFCSSFSFDFITLRLPRHKTPRSD